MEVFRRQMEGNRDIRLVFLCVNSLLEQNISKGELLKVDYRARKTERCCSS